MLQRSLQVLILATLFGLLATVLYALLRLRGPEDALREADDLLARGELAKVVSVLDQCDRTAAMQGSPTGREHLLRLRYEAHSRLGNTQAALRDLQNLLPLVTESDSSLRLDQIRLLAQVGRGIEALHAARTFLADHPDHGRALELAGEAGQSAYQEQLRSLLATLERDLGTHGASDARRVLLSCLYRPEGDPAVTTQIERLRSLYAVQPRLQQQWSAVLVQVRDLRGKVQESLDYYARSLEAGGQPVAAFSGMAMALEQAGRHDDVLALGETYLRRFRHVYTADAAAVLAWANLRDGFDAAAADVVNRWLPEGTFEQRLGQGALGPNAEDAMLARAFALWRLRDGAALDRLARDLRNLQGAGLLLRQAIHVSGGLASLLRGNLRDAEANLVHATNLLAARPKPLDRIDLLGELMPLRLQLARQRGAPRGEVLDIHATWAKARPGDPKPQRSRLEYHIELGEGTAAFAIVDELLRADPGNEDLLRLQASAASIVYRETNGDGAGLLQQCAQRGVLVPEVPHPVCLLLCAEAALQAGIPAIARECARLAIDRFPWATWPRLIEAEALLAGGRPTDAFGVLDQQLAASPGSQPAVLSLWLKAHRAAGISPAPRLAEIVRSCEPTADIATAMLRKALADDPTQASALALAAETMPFADAELLALAARGLAHADQIDRATALLQRATAMHRTPPAGQSASARRTTADRSAEVAAELAETVAVLLARQAAAAAWSDVDGPDRALALLHGHAFQHANAHAALLAAAEALATERPRTASALISHALAHADAEQRSGRAYAAAGRLCLRNGQWQLAESHWTAALSFDDGLTIAEDLARLLVHRSRPDRAAQVLRLCSSPTDPALQLRVGNRKLAASLARAALDADPADLAALCVLELSGTPSQVPCLEPLRRTDEPVQQQLCELLSLLAEPSLARECRPRAVALRAALGESPLGSLLFARAMLAADRPAEAAAIHRTLFAAGANDAAFHREVALAATRLDYPPPPEILRAMRLVALTAPGANSPTIATCVAQDAAREATSGGQPALASAMLAHVWLRWPIASGARVIDALALFERGETNAAVSLLDMLRRQASGRERLAAIDALFGLATRLGNGDPRTRRAAVASALSILTEEGAYGAPLHYLLEIGSNAADPRLDDDQLRRWLRAHLERCATGGDRPGLGVRSVAALEQRYGAAEALVEVDAVLQRHPAFLPLWRERARLLARLQQADVGIDDLRHLSSYVREAGLSLQLLMLAGEHRRTAPGDADALAALPAADRDSPAGRYTAGLLALRGGRSDAALPLLQQAGPRPDGSQLWFQALAALSSRDPNGGARAGELFERLAQEWPQSPVARYAQSFARQLAAR